MDSFWALFFLGATASAASLRGGTCHIDINNDFPKEKDPIFLVAAKDGQLSFVLPEKGSINLNKKGELLMACTGKKNSLLVSGDKLSSTKCSSGTKLSVNGKLHVASDFVCIKRSSASLKITEDICANDGSVIIQSGFEVDGQWLPLVDSCHNSAESKTYWSRHILYGTRLDNAVITSKRPGFAQGDRSLFKGFNPNTVYSQSNQEVIFEKIYGKKSSANYIRPQDTLYLARGHLSPDADFLFASWQMLTYFFINVAPQWQTINAGYWLDVENNARKAAINMNADLVSITGTYGLLELPDDEQNMKPAYLVDNRLPVPELFWKLLANEDDNSCIIFVSTNNPFLNEPPTTICPDICSETGWPELKTNLKEGYVYCCDYDSFKNVVHEVPDMKCKSELKFE